MWWKCYKTIKGVAMGSPLSGIKTEVFLQYYEQLILKHILEMKAAIYYNWYVGDSFIILNSTTITEEGLWMLWTPSIQTSNFY
jgi:hypothetical protein